MQNNRELPAMLAEMVERKASDLFLSVGARPLIKVEGEFIELADEQLDASTLNSLCYSILTDAQKRVFEGARELNTSLSISGVGRFRLNVFRQRGEPAIVVRHINARIPDLQGLQLPSLLSDIVMEDRGLILLVGGTGTGKSSTLAAMLAHRSRNRHGHILTIEDPIEFLHSHQEKSLINQREVGIDTESFSTALRNALREAPNVIMIGEIRDMETMKHALSYAETGHLCLATLHANNANQALERILHFFPDSAHAQVLQDLSLNLRAIICQRLVIGIDRFRVPAVEVMLNTPYISELIGAGKIELVKDAMHQASALGCKTMDDALYELVTQNRISQEEALRHADSRTNLALRLKLEGTGPQPVTQDTSHGQDAPPKKEISYVRKFNFGKYQSFRVNCVLFKCPNRELRSLMENSLHNIIASKGLQNNFDHPDLEVKFLYNAPFPEHEELTLLPEDSEPPVLASTGDSKPETIVIEMFDMHAGEPMWRLRANVTLNTPNMNQNRLTTELGHLLEEFPPPPKAPSTRG